MFDDTEIWLAKN